MFNELLFSYTGYLVKERGQGGRRKGGKKKRDKGRKDGGGKPGREEGKQKIFPLEPDIICVNIACLCPLSLA